jgi:hypothetical protein
MNKSTLLTVIGGYLDFVVRAMAVSAIAFALFSFTATRPLFGVLVIAVLAFLLWLRCYYLLRAIKVTPPSPDAPDASNALTKAEIYGPWEDQ